MTHSVNFAIWSSAHIIFYCAKGDFSIWYVIIINIIIIFWGRIQKHGILTVVRLNTRFPEMLLIFSKFGTYWSDFWREENYIISSHWSLSAMCKCCKQPAKLVNWSTNSMEYSHSFMGAICTLLNAAEWIDHYPADKYQGNQLSYLNNKGPQTKPKLLTFHNWLILETEVCIVFQIKIIKCIRWDSSSHSAVIAFVISKLQGIFIASKRKPRYWFSSQLFCAKNRGKMGTTYNPEKR